jgi:glycerol-3-phosphate dehydrogenase
MNVALVMTAVKLGATVANKVEVMKLLKNADGKIEGTRVRDNLTGEEWEVRARVISKSYRQHIIHSSDSAVRV